MVRSERGSALVESIPVISVLLVVITLLLTAAYLIFARVWIEFQCEQALYCLAEGKSEFGCQTQLRTKLKAFLPWGQMQTRAHNWKDEWQVDVKWHCGEYEFYTAKRLSPKLIMNKKALFW